MKKISLLLLMAMFSFATYAQVEKEHMDKDHMEQKEMKQVKMMSHEEDASMYSDKMATKLSLNAEQKEDLRKAQQKRWESMNEMKAKHKDEMAKIQDDFKEDLRDILDDSQYTKWEAMHNAEMKMHEGDKMAPKIHKEMKQVKMMSHEEDASMYSDKMATKLSLNAEQKEDLRKAQQKRWESMKDMKAEYKEEMASEDAEDMSKERAEMHEQMMKIQDDFKEDVREILDDNQYTKWETMHNEEMKMKMNGEKGKMKNKGMKMKNEKMKDVDYDDDNPKL
ncbi:hypothetical protein JM83_1862 [Gillisia sp. Hel_I_86]|uniref:hypothetical protein n=1 Tax=Gillisia sp. Hel_I_86 TaxID=1249981 RepID=UPI0011999D08|nr:hypothetical protein [Gillisia sp. Hel_I_86]TVZ26871.1 hypothetical protein JM83_1862 [Gillisia sp. Hel_I_86]